MRADEIVRPILPQESLMISELGGDGAVTVVGIRFGQKIALSALPASQQATGMLAMAVVDDDGGPLMSADDWDVFGSLHEDAFISLLQAARRVSGIEVAEAKKD